MAKTKRKKSGNASKPAKRCVLNILDVVIEGIKPMHKDKRQDIALLGRLSMQNVLRGKGVPKDLYSLNTSLSLAEIFASQGVGVEYAGVIDAGIDGLIRAFERLNETGKVGLDGEAMRLIDECLSVLEAQVEIVSTNDVREAIEKARLGTKVSRYFDTQTKVPS